MEPDRIIDHIVEVSDIMLEAASSPEPVRELKVTEQQDNLMDRIRNVGRQLERVCENLADDTESCHLRCQWDMLLESCKAIAEECDTHCSELEHRLVDALKAYTADHDSDDSRINRGRLNSELLCALDDCFTDDYHALSKTMRDTIFRARDAEIQVTQQLRFTWGSGIKLAMKRDHHACLEKYLTPVEGSVEPTLKTGKIPCEDPLKCEFVQALSVKDPSRWATIAVQFCEAASQVVNTGGVMTTFLAHTWEEA
ncbi:hypothetical protein EIP91_003327 [Steccherinum ochraceum]|uniref:Fungal N-terminal domain-containing protein n=1 Tax=Steccherinum ochraceum TaxID=92696 RepID=A0A4R0RD83_9APHY|nr:hypothetical protein EIP91_003327 [Steccherinum ochraceum]